MIFFIALQDSAGGKVQDSSSGGGILDSFGGGPSGKSQTEKTEALVEQAKKPNPASNFLGDIFGAVSLSILTPPPPSAQTTGCAGLAFALSLYFGVRICTRLL